MANFSFRGVVGNNAPETGVFDVVAGAVATIAVGDIVVLADGYAALVANGGGTTGQRLGLAISTSTDTVAAAGSVQVMFAPSGLVLQGKATTPGNLTTARKFDKVTIDVSGSTITVDEDDTTNGAVTIYQYPESDFATTGIINVILPFNIY